MRSTNKWLSVIGIEEQGLASLSQEALDLVDRADVIFGGARHLAMLQGQKAERHQWQSPFTLSIAEIEKQRGRNIVVLATGNPQWYGIGNVLCRKFAPEEIEIIPARSAFSLAAGKIGWSLAGAQTLSLHGRRFSSLARYITPNAKLLILTSDRTTPVRIANHLEERGFGDSLISVMEHLGGEKERIRCSIATGFDLEDIADLNTVAVECIAGPDAVWHSCVPGLPDDAFKHDGQLTKRVVRAVTLSALQPYPGALLLDVGAGCGSIGIEWMRTAENAKAIAIEENKTRCVMIRENAADLGVPGLKTIEGRAPDALAELPRTDAVFIGGGLTNQGMFEACWQSLKASGILVANGVTLESEALLIELHRQYGGELTRISVEKATPMGEFHGWQQAKPVIQWRIVKPEAVR